MVVANQALNENTKVRGPWVEATLFNGTASIEIVSQKLKDVVKTRCEVPEGCSCRHEKSKKTSSRLLKKMGNLQLSDSGVSD